MAVDKTPPLHFSSSIALRVVFLLGNRFNFTFETVKITGGKQVVSCYNIQILLDIIIGSEWKLGGKNDGETKNRQEAVFNIHIC